jgi:hypothetical protein
MFLRETIEIERLRVNFETVRGLVIERMPRKPQPALCCAAIAWSAPPIAISGARATLAASGSRDDAGGGDRDAAHN